MPVPAISVALPIYNSERFLAECIHSLKAQTFEDFEVVAVLDGCNDRSEEILMDMRDDKFVIVKKDRNEGLAAVLNTALAHATAPIIARMDADDLIHPERFRLQFEFLTRDPQIDVLGTWFDYINEKGNCVKKAFPFPSIHEEIRRDFRIRNSIGGATTMFRKERILHVGGYPTDFRLAQDLALWLKCLATDIQFANLPEILYHYRQYGMQASRQRRAEQLRLTNLAYELYGPAIWGNDAPKYELGLPLHRRIFKKLKRILQKK
ncbi:glycosyltransferase [bacterium]|nr:glycosyltransferase [bacterium]